MVRGIKENARSQFTPTSFKRCKMEKKETSLPGVFEIWPRILKDNRGYFLETYHQKKYAELGIDDLFVQDNQSFSTKGTLRGLHYQLRHPQSKLCWVVEGEVLDIAVDIRKNSPTFGKSIGIILSAEKQNQIYIPRGFAHGFLALTDKIRFFYKCSDFYFPEDERGILWSDPDLAISWGLADPVISEKDLRNPRLKQVHSDLLPE